MKSKISDSKPVELTEDNICASNVWNMLDGKLDWSNLNAVLEYFEVEDCDMIISCLINLKEYTDQMKSAQ